MNNKFCLHQHLIRYPSRGGNRYADSPASALCYGFCGRGDDLCSGQGTDPGITAL